MAAAAAVIPVELECPDRVAGVDCTANLPRQQHPLPRQFLGVRPAPRAAGVGIALGGPHMSRVTVAEAPRVVEALRQVLGPWVVALAGRAEAIEADEVASCSTRM